MGAHESKSRLVTSWGGGTSFFLNTGFNDFFCTGYLRKRTENKEAGGFGNAQARNSKATALSGLDGPPVPPDFVFESSISPTASLEEKTSVFNIKSARAHSDKQVSGDMNEIFEKMNTNFRNSGKFSLSEASSSTRVSSVDQAMLRQKREAELENEAKLNKVCVWYFSKYDSYLSTKFNFIFLNSIQMWLFNLLISHFKAVKFREIVLIVENMLQNCLYLASTRI